MQPVERKHRLRRRDPPEEEKDHRALSILERNTDNTMHDEQDHQWQHQCRHQAGRPGHRREGAGLIHLRGGRQFELRPRFVNDRSGIEKQGGLEEAMGAKVKHGQSKGAQSALHDHVAHLSHCGIDEAALHAGLR
ncbi:MAG: hypothetical protein DYH03_03180 [Nitrospira sp. NTP1]|nr:hypothetical protein [Nitrospira sp. NTP1]